MTEPIKVWDFYSAPEELRINYNGGDEDLVILIPPGVDIPFHLEYLGCSSNDKYSVDADGRVSRLRTRDDQDSLVPELTDWRCPNYPNHTIIIPCHS